MYIHVAQYVFCLNFIIHKYHFHQLNSSNMTLFNFIFSWKLSLYMRVYATI
jgi:hypothetical protein